MYVYMVLANSNYTAPCLWVAAAPTGNTKNACLGSVDECSHEAPSP